MDLGKFCSQVEASEDLCGVGMGINEGVVDSFVVKYKPSGTDIKLPIEAVKKCDWSMLYDVITGRREPAVIQHMTRIVGYYSKISNWNPSKIGELGDRKKGEYEVEASKD